MDFRKATGQIIKDQKKLSFDYVPSDLPNRDEQMKRLFTLFKGVVNTEVSQNVFLHGQVGTGKTVTAKRFCMDFQEWGSEEGQKVDYVFVNCRRRNNSSSAMWKIVNHFDKGFPDRGFSVGEMMEILRKHIKKKGTHLLVVLDEADALIKKDGSELIYLLTRFDDENISPEGNVSLMLISQKNAFELLEEGAKSSFKRSNRVKFPKYDASELYDILKDRVEMALYPGSIKDEDLKFLSQIAGERGDARFGIELLEKGSLLAEEKGKDTVHAEEIRAAKAEVDPYLTESRIKELNDQERLILLSATRLLKNDTFTTTGDVEEQYKVICEEYGGEPLGHTQFWKYLNSISDKGLLDTSTDTTGTGRTTKVSLSEIPAGRLEEKLQEILS